MTHKLLIADWAWTLAVPADFATFRAPGVEWAWLEGVKEALEFLHQGGMAIAVEEQEGGIAAGHVEYTESLVAMHQRLRELSFPVPFLMCPYSWLGEREHQNPYRAYKSWRKPSPVSLLLLAAQFPNIAQHEVLVIGDRGEDAKAASMAGFDYRDASDFFYDVWEAMGDARPAAAQQPAAAQDVPEEMPF